MQFASIYLFAAAWTAPEVSQEEGSYASRFYRRFWESFKELSFTSRSFALFNWDFFAQLLGWGSLLWLSMTWRQRYLAQNFLNITLLTWTQALHCCFSQEKPLQWKETNTCARARTHARTHTRTHDSSMLNWTLYSNGVADVTVKVQRFTHKKN